MRRRRRRIGLMSGSKLTGVGSSVSVVEIRVLDHVALSELP